MHEINDNVEILLSKIPYPSEGSDEAFARGIIEVVLNYMLNRQIHELSDQGYLNSKKYFKVGGWEADKPSKTLQLKYDLMDEAIEKFSQQIIDELVKHREKL